MSVRILKLLTNQNGSLSMLYLFRTSMCQICSRHMVLYINVSLLTQVTNLENQK